MQFINKCVSMLKHHYNHLARPVFKADLIAVYLFGCVFNLPL